MLHGAFSPFAEEDHVIWYKAPDQPLHGSCGENKQTKICFFKFPWLRISCQLGWFLWPWVKYNDIAICSLPHLMYLMVWWTKHNSVFFKPSISLWKLIIAASHSLKSPIYLQIWKYCWFPISLHIMVVEVAYWNHDCLPNWLWCHKILLSLHIFNLRWTRRNFPPSAGKCLLVSNSGHTRVK